jgi:hypothetical protein
VILQAEKNNVTNIGIIAHALKVDIAYIDSKDEYIQWGIPQPVVKCYIYNIPTASLTNLKQPH